MIQDIKLQDLPPSDLLPPMRFCLNVVIVLPSVQHITKPISRSEHSLTLIRSAFLGFLVRELNKMDS